jgi:ABC-2 type transport system ATP-binding protein
VAAALLGRPQTVVLDEPVNGLDPDGVRWIRLLLRSLEDFIGHAATGDVQVRTPETGRLAEAFAGPAVTVTESRPTCTSPRAP